MTVVLLVASLAAAGAARAVAHSGRDDDVAPPSAARYPGAIATGLQGTIVAQAKTGPLVAPLKPPPEFGRELPVPGALPSHMEKPGIIRKRLLPAPGAARPQPDAGSRKKQTEPPSPMRQPGARSLPLGRGVAPPSLEATGQLGEGAGPRMIVDDPPQVVDPLTKMIIVPVTPGEAAEPLDSREPVSAADLDHLPYSAVGRITTVHASGARLLGTGFMIAPGLVLTAAHVLDDYRQGPALQVTFEPGCAAGTRQANGAGAQTVQRDRYRIAPGWRSASYPLRHDFAVIALPPAPWHRDCGWLAPSPVERSFLGRHVRLATRRFILAGFPSDRPEGGQWAGRGRLSSESGTTVNHKIDTEKGQSGAPIIAVVSDAASAGRKKRAVPIAIHSRMGAALAVNHNSARVLDREALDHIRQLAAELGTEF